MKAITISTDNEIKKIEVEQNGKPLYKLMREAVGGLYENVYPKRLPQGYVMIVNEEGLILGLDRNAIGSYLYETDKHGSPIVGNIIFLKLGVYENERDVVGLSDEEADELMTFLEETFKKMKEQAKADMEALCEEVKGEFNND